MPAYACDDQDGEMAVISINNMANGDVLFYCLESVLNWAEVMLGEFRPDHLAVAPASAADAETPVDYLPSEAVASGTGDSESEPHAGESELSDGDPEYSGLKYDAEASS